jgi:hypothetical protein
MSDTSNATTTPRNPRIVNANLRPSSSAALDEVESEMEVDETRVETGKRSKKRKQRNLETETPAKEKRRKVTKPTRWISSTGRIYGALVSTSEEKWGGHPTWRAMRRYLDARHDKDHVIMVIDWVKEEGEMMDIAEAIKTATGTVKSPSWEDHSEEREPVSTSNQ